MTSNENINEELINQGKVPLFTNQRGHTQTKLRAKANETEDEAAQRLQDRQGWNLSSVPYHFVEADKEFHPGELETCRFCSTEKEKKPVKAIAKPEENVDPLVVESPPSEEASTANNIGLPVRS